MNQAIEAALSNSPDVSGYLVSDSNGLAISAKGDLQSKLKYSGRFTSIINNSTLLNDANVPAVVVIETTSSKQMYIKKVGDMTVVVSSNA